MEDPKDFHPMFPKLIVKATEYLLKNGFQIIPNTEEGNVFINNNNFYIRLINQRYEVPDVCIGKRFDKELIRLDFILEYFLSGNNEIALKHSKLKTWEDENNYFNFHSELLNKYLNKIMEINPFPTQYYEWRKDNSILINELAEALRK